MLVPGQKIGRYIVEGPLGQGGMGSVYKGRDTVLDMKVAIKEINPMVAQTQEGVESFKAEAKLAINLRHPAIVGFIDFIVVDQAPRPPDLYLVTQFVEGRTLEAIVTDCHRSNRFFSQDKAIEIVREILNGLGYAHSHGVIHRDIKPANVMLNEATGQVMLIDFGIARTGGPSQHTQFIAAGAYSHFYSPPEQVTGQGTTARTDIYAVGVLLYELLTGRTISVFPENSSVRLGNDTLTHLPGVSPAVERVILKAVAVTPGHRYQTAEEFAAALGALVGGVTPPQAPPPQTPSGPPPTAGPTTRRTNLDIRRT